MYNRDWLKTQIMSYLHDSSVSAELDAWIDLGAKRVSQVLQCLEMEGELTRNAGDTELHIVIPSLVRHVLGVQWSNYSGRWMNLRSVPRHDAGQYKRDGTPSVYYIEDGRIKPSPYVDGDYRAQVINEVVIPADTSEVAALTAYPFIFLNAALSEAYDWKQDPEMMARYEQKWSTEADYVTALYLSNRIGDTPAMRAV